MLVHQNKELGGAYAFTESTRYKDVALSPTLFQWESQSQTSQASPTGQRYINHQAEGGHILLFVRRVAGEPFVFAGPAKYVSHEATVPFAFDGSSTVLFPS